MPDGASHEGIIGGTKPLITTTENLRPQDVYYKFVVDSHSEFIQKKWSDTNGAEKPHFHSPKHFMNAARVLTNIAQQAEAGDDPLMIKTALENEGYTLREFKNAGLLFGLLHDLGNFMGTIKIDSNGVLQPIYMDKFREKNAVKRTLRMIDAITAHFQGYTTIVIELLKRMIADTLYDPLKKEYVEGRNDSIALAARTADLFGSLLLANTSEQAQGLVAEKISEKTMSPSEVPAFINNFHSYPLQHLYEMLGEDFNVAGNLIRIIVKPQSNLFLYPEKSS